MKEETKKFDEIVSRLLERIESLEERLALRNAVCEQETTLKNQCFSFLVHKKLYQEWSDWRNTEMAKDSVRFLLSK